MTALLLCRAGDDAGLARVVGDGRFLIGPSSERDDFATDRRRAVVMQEESGRFVIEDLGSQGVVRVNGRPLAEGEVAPISHLDVVSIAEEEEYVLLELKRVPMTEIVAAAVVGPDGARVGLQVGASVVGSGDDCDLVVTLPGVAARHARLVLSSSAVSVEPIDGEVFVNGRTGGGQLADGDVLRLGPDASFEIEVLGGLADRRRGAGAEDDEEDASDVASKDTTTVSPEDVSASLARARERHERYLARARNDVRQERIATGGADHSKPPTLSRRLPRMEAGTPRREAAARLHFRLPQAGHEVVTLLREGKHVVGRHSGCRVSLPDLSVSREHAEVRIEPQGIVLRDLGSANGTWIGSERVDECLVPAGARVRFGSVDAWFEQI